MTAAVYAPFQDSAVCPKCRYRMVDVAWYPSTPVVRYDASGPDVEVVAGFHAGRGECLMRTCHRCRFHWFERCADAPTPGAEEGP